MTESALAFTGRSYADLIASYIVENFGRRGLAVYREVSVGKTIIGKNRHVDIFLVHPDTARAFAIECKYQETAGTADEKIPYTIRDMEVMGIPGCIVYAGAGFSEGILHMLAACPIAAMCLPNATLVQSRDTRELDVQLAMAFHWWDLIVQGKSKVTLDR